MLRSPVAFRRGWLQAVAAHHTVVPGMPMDAAPPHPGGDRRSGAPAPGARLLSPLLALLRAWRRQRDLRWLAEADERMLRDVGVARYEVRRRLHPLL